MTETTANYDEPWKAAIGEYFPSFLDFFFPKIHNSINWKKTPISLDKELEEITASATTEKRYADKLFKVWLLDEQEIWILIHIEVQSQYDREFSMRMFIYNYRAFDLYNKPVISLAILGDETPSWRPNVYKYGLEESEMRLKFSIVKLLDYKWEELSNNQNPFAIIVMAHLRTKSTTSNLTEREKWKWELVRGLYEKGLTKYDIIKLFQFIDKMMQLPIKLQSSFQIKINQYEEEQKVEFLSTMEELAIEKGKQIGEQIGKEIGQQIGKEIGQQIGQQEGAISNNQQSIINLLEKRFGELPENLRETINKIDDISLLERLLLETISVNSVAEFEELIPKNSSGEN